MTFAALPEGVGRVGLCRLRVSSAAWPAAVRARADIDAAWAATVARQPSFFNGRIFMLAAARMSDGVFEGVVFETDFASYHCWRESGFADAGVRDVFGSGLVLSREGHLLLGRQVAGNLNSGSTYPPGGFIDLRDVGADGYIDLDASIRREVEEETGLDGAALERLPGYLVTHVGRHVSIGAPFRSELPAEALRATVRSHLAAAAHSELDDVVMLARREEAADHALPEFARLLVDALLGP